jgi:allophanate hydrolase subunit 2
MENLRSETRSSTLVGKLLLEVTGSDHHQSLKHFSCSFLLMKKERVAYFSFHANRRLQGWEAQATQGMPCSFWQHATVHGTLQIQRSDSPIYLGGKASGLA